MNSHKDMRENDLENSLLKRSKLVPELVVANLNESLKFWVGILGFKVAYARVEEKFAYLDLDGAQVMLEERGGIQGQWLTATLERPFGRGINFQIEVSAVSLVLDRLGQAGISLFRDCRDSWYVAGAVEIGQREFVVRDPDGYLVRLVERLGERPIV
jgi:catechol 2,3-dioxygenase-like lactoylglutathione lyase family enzyme